ncbi:MAG: hypothetical protein IJV15_00270 [Lachnospiraceae bacterium]|nr:hypothetical protein [Lachnospiraceae bacterium]
MNFKETITSIPNYNDGCFYLYKISQNQEDIYPLDKLEKVLDKPIYYEELSITDKLRFIASERDVDIRMKIRIPQTKEINSLNVLKIGEHYYKVFNAYHFTNQDGFKQTDLTLIDYKKRG